MSAIFEPITTTDMNGTSFLICTLIALVCGCIVAATASFRSYPSKSFLISLILLPAIVSTVIVMVNGNIGTGVAVMGAFSLVRFRSVPGKAKDIVSIFLAMTSGLACAAGYPWLAVIFTIAICAVTIVVTFIPMGTEKIMDLSVTIPETLHFAKEFDDIFERYTKRHRLVKTKTSNMGSLYKLSYKIEMKNPSQIQEFIDALRCRNGNLEISLAPAAEGSEEL